VQPPSGTRHKIPLYAGKSQTMTLMFGTRLSQLNDKNFAVVRSIYRAGSGHNLLPISLKGAQISTSESRMVSVATAVLINTVWEAIAIFTSRLGLGILATLSFQYGCPNANHIVPNCISKMADSPLFDESTTHSQHSSFNITAIILYLQPASTCLWAAPVWACP